MSFYGISCIRKDTATGEVKICLVHEIEKVGDEFHTKLGFEKSFEDVANRISAGDCFHVLTKGEGSDYKKGDIVCVKAGQSEYLFSHPNNSLFDLPTF